MMERSRRRTRQRDKEGPNYSPRRLGNRRNGAPWHRRAARPECSPCPKRNLSDSEPRSIPCRFGNRRCSRTRRMSYSSDRRPVCHQARRRSRGCCCTSTLQSGHPRPARRLGQRSRPSRSRVGLHEMRCRFLLHTQPVKPTQSREQESALSNQPSSLQPSRIQHRGTTSPHDLTRNTESRVVLSRHSSSSRQQERMRALPRDRSNR
jgi:hypothetical protein